MTLTDLGDLLRAHPCAWRDLSPEQRVIAEASLLPHLGQPFSEAQRYWFARWWLVCTQADVDAINALLPVGTQVSPTEINGALYLGADLLTDSRQEGSTFFAAAAILDGLICTYFETP